MVLGRNRKQLWHLMRTMTTQLVQNERIYTTQAKAKLLVKHAQRIVINAKRSVKGENSGTNLLKATLTTKKAFTKSTLQLAERFKQQKSHFVRRSDVLYRRRGDDAPMVKIEYRGNEMEKTEKSQQQQFKKQDPFNNVKFWKKNLFRQYDQFLNNQLKNATSDIERKVLAKQLKSNEFELKIENRERKQMTEFKELY